MICNEFHNLESINPWIESIENVRVYKYVIYLYCLVQTGGQVTKFWYLKSAIVTKLSKLGCGHIAIFMFDTSCVCYNCFNSYNDYTTKILLLMKAFPIYTSSRMSEGTGNIHILLFTGLLNIKLTSTKCMVLKKTFPSCTISSLVYYLNTWRHNKVLYNHSWYQNDKTAVQNS